MQETEKTFETEVLTRLAVIESKLDDYKKIEDIAYRAYNNSKQNKEDIEEMKDNNKWLKRTVIGESIGLLFLIISTILMLGLGLK